MFARHVSMHLKPNTRAQFTQQSRTRFFPGFGNSTASATKSYSSPRDPERNWWPSVFGNTKEDAEAYHRGSYTEVVKALAKMVEGTPEVRNFDVASSTLQKTAARVAA